MPDRDDRRQHVSADRRAPYLLTLPAYGFYWFQLRGRRRSRDASDRSRAGTVHAGPHRRLERCSKGASASRFERTIAAAFLTRGAGSPAKARAIDGSASSRSPPCRAEGQDASSCRRSRSSSDRGGEPALLRCRSPSRRTRGRGGLPPTPSRACGAARSIGLVLGADASPNSR